MPDDITVTGSFSLSEVEERLKQPVLTVNLLLVIQLNGGTAYSDGLAVLLLTSDDVAQKYHLPHSSRLLRPMPLDMTNFEDDITLFLETQTVACHTPSVIGDAKKWTERSAALITQGGKMHTPWKAEDIALLEKWCGIPGPAAPRLLTALAADLVSLRKQPLLALFSSEQEHFISTITPGVKMNIPGNGTGRFGTAGLTLAGMAAIWWGITRYGGMLNINTRGEQVLAFVWSVWRWYLFLPSCNVPPCEGEFISPAVAAGQRLTRRRRARGADTSPSYYGGGNSPDSTLSVWTRLVPQSPYSADNWLSQRRRTTDPKAHAGTLAGRSGYIIAVGWRPWGSGR